MGILGHLKNNSLGELCVYTFDMGGQFELPLDFGQVLISTRWKKGAHRSLPALSTFPPCPE